MQALSDHQFDIETITKQENFVREYVTDLDMAVKIIESLIWKAAPERLDYLFYYYPEIAKMRHWQIARLTGFTRETVTRYIKASRAELQKI